MNVFALIEVASFHPVFSRYNKANLSFSTSYSLILDETRFSHRPATALTEADAAFGDTSNIIVTRDKQRL